MNLPPMRRLVRTRHDYRMLLGTLHAEQRGLGRLEETSIVTERMTGSQR